MLFRSGITIGSFVSVSLEPALVGFLPGLNSHSWQAIAASGKFCVNVLADGQDDLCWKFAKESDDKFDGVAWEASPTGLPELPGCVAVIDCTIHSQIELGDHYMVVGHVQSLDHVDDAGDAMAFYKGKVKTARFYMKTLGAKLIEANADQTHFRVDLHGVTLNITDHVAHQKRVQKYGIEHFAVQTDDFDGTRAKLLREGAVALEEMVSPVPAHRGGRICFLEGPEGIQLELIEIMP